MADKHDRFDWNDDDAYWRNNYRSRPYAASTSNDYEYYRPGYRYGHEAASRYEGREWDDVESDLSSSWNSYEHRGTSTWEQMKAAVRDAWDRVRGRRTVSAR
jgi:hypothetical protein